jgi:hypothetical protein
MSLICHNSVHAERTEPKGLNETKNCKTSLILKTNFDLVSDARYLFRKEQQMYGAIMSETVRPTYTRAGIVKRTGLGLVMEIAGVCYYITPDEVPSLLVDQGAEVVNHIGEPEGTAWLSPAITAKKQELTALIRERIFIVRYDEMKRVLTGDQLVAPVKEYHSEN